MRFHFRLKFLLVGVLAGVSGPALILSVLAAAGLITITGLPVRLSLEEILLTLPAYLAIMIFIGISEEILFRGMLAREWAARLGWPAATLLSGVLFGLLHIFSAPVTGVLSVMNLIGFGIIFTALFTALYVRAGSLWLPIGFHAGWNFCLIAIMGTPVSGVGSTFSLFKMKILGPIWISGGSFGIEQSIIAYGVAILASIVILKFPFNRRIMLLNAGADDDKSED
jgi:membrane protease YdiL (CAAX protease family)